MPITHDAFTMKRLASLQRLLDSASGLPNTLRQLYA